MRENHTLKLELADKSTDNTENWLKNVPLGSAGNQTKIKKKTNKQTPKTPVSAPEIAFQTLKLNKTSIIYLDHLHACD